MAIESSLSQVRMTSLPEEDFESATGMEAPGETVEENGEDEEGESAFSHTPKERKKAGTLRARLIDQIDDVNLAAYLTDAELDEIGIAVVQDFQVDENSREEWWDRAEKAIKFATQVAQQKTFPWPKACYSLDTDVLTDSGWRPVADLKIGDLVLSRSADGAASYHPVTQTFRHRAEEVVHFQGKSIDLLVTPNHRMLVEDRDTGAASFIEAGEFVRKQRCGPNGIGLARKSIPLTSGWEGAEPETIYGIEAKAYMRFLGWYISEGNAIYAKTNRHVNKAGDTVDYGPTTSSFSIAQCRRANPEKYAQILADIEACGFTASGREKSITVHAKSMPALLKAELRSLGTVYEKRIPRHALALSPRLLNALLDTMLAGDGHVRQRAHQTRVQRSYFTTSRLLADQVQEIAQKIGLRATMSVVEARAGGVVNGRQITGLAQGYSLNIATKPTVQVLKLQRDLIPYDEDVACVEVEPHHTLYVRRNGKAVWCGNSNVIYPLIAQAAVEFNARLFPAIIQNRKVVKGVVWGSDDGRPATIDGKPDGQPVPPMPGPDGKPQPVWLVAPGDKRKRADRIAEHMSWQLLHQMPEWQEQTDQLLIQLPIVGGVVRKTWYDTAEKRNRSEIVSLANIVWNYHAPSFRAATRHTEKLLKYPHEIVEAERAEEFLPQFYGPGGGGEGETYGWNRNVVSADQGDEDSAHIFLEQHRRLDLDGDGYAEPYIVTVHLRSSKTIRIVANYLEEDIKTSKDGDTVLRICADDKYTLYSFMPSMDDGCYPTGFGTLLRPLNSAINTALNQMFDAGTLQNAGGGFVSDQLGLPSGQTLFKVGTYTRVTTKGADIRASVFPIPFQGPSQVLFSLLGMLMQSAEKLAATGNILAGDASIANAPPTTVLALIEQGMKIYTAIHKRVYLAEKGELDKLYRLNRLHINEAEGYTVGDEYKEIEPDDYKQGGGVEPVADPTMLTDMQKLGRAQILMDFKGDPIVDQVEIRRRLFEAAGMDRIDDLFAKPDAAQAQFAMALQQAELGKLRADELKSQTQAFLNMALARKNATAQEEGFIEAQLNYLRLTIESINAETRARQADTQRRSAYADHVQQHADRLHTSHESALDRAHEMALSALEGSPATPTPAPDGAFPQAPVAPGGPAVTKPAPGGMPAPDMGPVPPLPSGPTLESGQ